MIFTAMAVLAFSAVSMAKSPQVMKKVNKVSVKVAGPDCELHRFLTYVEARRQGLNERDASAASYSAYFSCMAIR
jgi:hypothetical protein